ncbi:hypothetical protein Droror1_Dr00001422 [Drosera rotundifolia]
MGKEPVTPSSKIQRTPTSTPGGSKVREEKILVTVRVRPLCAREQAMYDLVAWDCPDEHTIVLKQPNDQRSSCSYTFDRVFGPTCTTQRVYNEGAKDVTLSPLTGINATIFAYGQTSSGKTYTMRGITKNAIKDIYEHMKNNPQKDFLLRISALEIYNEEVFDLLNNNSGPLRVLDDPEKGTFVEKLVEKVVDDGQHLKQLISICEAQRQVGETAFNDKSSRSHQIIRLSIESQLRENSGCVKSFTATLNFVDLAGSEPGSATKVEELRWKEGRHINLSLLTLTQVIRKLSGGKKIGHIPYRESKLTRILQTSLGGNARTAIICTMSPALSHVEQSRVTLSFATSAKEVTNAARVNMVVSDQQLVKRLQKELVEKDLKIQQMEVEMRELKRERDLAQSQLIGSEKKGNKERKWQENSGPSHQARKCLAFSAEPASVGGTSEARHKNNSRRRQTLRQSVTSTDPSLLMQEIRKLEMLQRQLGEEANRALDFLHKEMASNKLGTQGTAETIAKLLSDIKNMPASNTITEEIVLGDKAVLKEEIVRLNSQACTIESIEKKLDNVQNSINKLVGSFTSGDDTVDSKSTSKKKKMTFNLSNSPSVSTFIRAPCSPLSSSRKVMDEIGNKVTENNQGVTSADTDQCKTPSKAGEDGKSRSSKENTPISPKSNSMSVKKMQKMFKNAAEENIRSIRAYVTELKERVAKLQYQKQLLVCQVLELEANEGLTGEPETVDQLSVSWQSLFGEQRKQILMLWHLCHVSLVHRTQFFLLFRGDPADQIYMEVELRRLTWLEQHLFDLGNASPALLGDDPNSHVASSIKALKQEREHLAKRVSTKLTPEEREMYYIKWEIPPEVKQKRRLQLVNKLWTDPYNMDHIRESAEIVAKLVGFCESGEENATREMFELNFRSPSDKKSWMGWNLISNLLHL